MIDFIAVCDDYSGGKTVSGRVSLKTTIADFIDQNSRLADKDILDLKKNILTANKTVA
jgi:hypothetical protein